MPQSALKRAGEKPRSILFVANTDWYLYNFRLSLLEAARDKGWDVELVCPPGEYADKLRSLGFRVTEVELSSKGYGLAHEVKGFCQLARAVRRSNADVIHLFTLKCVLYGFAIEAARRRGTRLIGAITGLGHAFTSGGLRNGVSRLVITSALRLTMSRCNAALIFQNDSDRDEFVSKNIIDYENTHVIRGSGFDENRFYPMDRRYSIQPSTDPLSFLFCGRLMVEKGIHEYLNAIELARSRGHHLKSSIAGTVYPGNPSSLTVDQINRLKAKNNHLFLGHYENMPELFGKCDVVVLPSYREGTPKALIEAAASGCIIIASDIPGCAGVVEQGVNGFLVPPRDAKALSLAIEQVIQLTEDEQLQMKRASRSIAIAKFSDATVINSTLSTYDI